ncbi:MULTISPECIES: hypothetical protein [Bacillus cereus group]|uniref:hypothetical protein n=1 Tax=Bacillus cereus group TaxID=86661 RepID=UPI001F5AD82A|nr:MULTISPECIES: hypothetical protein [Bacillus cereus group]
MKFSILRDEVLLINQRGEMKTVKEIKDILQGDDQYDKDELFQVKWYHPEKENFHFYAESLINSTLSNINSDIPKNSEWYMSGWYQEAYECFNQEDIEEIQRVLDRCFARNTNVFSFYVGRGEIIDLRR